MKYTLKDNFTGKEAVYKTVVDVNRTGDAIKFDFVCENSTRHCPYEGFNAPLYTGDVVEAFVCLDKTRKNYFEIELAPNGSAFIAKVTYRGKKDFDCDFVKENFLTSTVTPTESGYLASFSVPLKAIGYKDGDEIVYNAYRIDTDGKYRDKHLFALNPTMCDTFHCPEYFIKLV